MASSLSSIAAKDGTGTTVAGGILAVDKSGASTGPFFAAQAIVDPQGVNTAAVKAASTAPVAGDPALVVSLSPNSVNANGQATMINSAPVVIASNQAAFPVNATGVDQYATHKEVAASQTAAVLGATGAIGDYLSHVTVFPAIAACGVVTVLDAASTVGTFPGGGVTALPSLAPFTIMIGAFCTGAGWKITTGANVAVTAVGKFT